MFIIVRGNKKAFQEEERGGIVRRFFFVLAFFFFFFKVGASSESFREETKLKIVPFVCGRRLGDRLNQMINQRPPSE